MGLVWVLQAGGRARPRCGAGGSFVTWKASMGTASKEMETDEVRQCWAKVRKLACILGAVGSHWGVVSGSCWLKRAF